MRPGSQRGGAPALFAAAGALALAFAPFAAGCGDDVGTGGGGGGAALPLEIVTSVGTLEGFASGSSRVFLGIPYAAPPVGPLRFRPPAPHPGLTGKLAAIARGPMCPQRSPLDQSFAEGSSEDCLTLNVWAPSAASATPRPILFWIHGGGYVLGSGGEAAYDGQALSEGTGSIVVTINYRLGALGFLALPELDEEDPSLPSGNYGLLDQRAALAWVRANAAAFDGDPGRITIFGESAGGASVCQHLVSPGSAGMFAAAILQSGPCNLVNEQAAAHAVGQSLVQALGCPVGEVASCLRQRSASEIITALPGGGFSLAGGGPAFYPTVEGVTLPDRPEALLAAGSFEHVPTIVGSNADEATLFLVLGGLTIDDEAAFLELAEQLVPGRGAEVVARYPSAEYGSAQDAALAAFTDAGFTCPARRTARAVASAGADAYLYSFRYGAPSLFGDLGAFHSAEIKYVFGTPGQLLPAPLTDDELGLSANMMAYWSRLGATQSPNGAPQIEWPRYQIATEPHLEIDLALSVGARLRSAQCDFWDGVDTGF